MLLETILSLSCVLHLLYYFPLSVTIFIHPGNSGGGGGQGSTDVPLGSDDAWLLLFISEGRAQS